MNPVWKWVNCVYFWSDSRNEYLHNNQTLFTITFRRWAIPRHFDIHLKQLFRITSKLCVLVFLNKTLVSASLDFFLNLDEVLRRANKDTKGSFFKESYHKNYSFFRKHVFSKVVDNWMVMLEKMYTLKKLYQINPINRKFDQKHQFLKKYIFNIF